MSDTTRAPLLTIGEVALRLNVQVRHVRRLVHERRIPYLKWGHLLRFDPAAIGEWLEEARIAPESAGMPAHRAVIDSGRFRRSMADEEAAR
jgi:excisionase family DNA binding protein